MKSRNSDYSRADALQQVIELLLQGITLHTIAGSPKDYVTLLGSINEISDAMAAEGADLVAQAESVIRSLGEYRRRTDEFFGLRFAEWQKTVHLLMEAITTISAPDKDHREWLRDIEDQLSGAAEVEEMRLIQTRLSECLEAIRRESRAEAIACPIPVASPEAPAQPAAAPEPAPVKPALDSVTGLPGRSEAEAAIERAHQLKQSASAAVVVLDSLVFINSKYGRKAGDIVLQAFAEHTTSKLPPGDRAFRWSGPALVLLLQQDPHTGRIREEFGRLMKAKFEHTIQTSSRIIHLPITRRWVVLSLNLEPAELFHSIDNFVAP